MSNSVLSSSSSSSILLLRRKHTVFGCQLIHDATKKLSYPPNVAVTAQSIFHRFYMRRYFDKTDALTGAMGCFVLGCKVEEVPIVLREVVFVFFELFLERKKLPVHSLEVSNPIFMDWKSELIMIERIILKELGFSLYTIADHPHQYIVYIMGKLHSEFSSVLEGRDTELTTLAESAWHYLNESKKTDIELRYDPLAIACGAILLASTVHNIILPETPLPWWLVFEVDYDAMKDICNEIFDMYDLEVKADDWLTPLYTVEYQEKTYATFRR